MRVRRAGGRTHARALLAAAAWLALAPAAPARAAADPQAEAVKQLVAAQNAARSAFRAALAAASAQAGAEIDTAEQGLAASGDATACGNALFQTLQAFQISVTSALVAAANAQANAAKTQLAGLGSDLGGIFPRAFYTGDATPAAAFEEAIAKDLEKSYTRLRRRLAKTAQRFEAAGFGLNFRVRAPRALPPRRWSENETDFLLVFAARIDTALAWSNLSVAGDGQLRVAGAASSNALFPDVNLEISRLPDSVSETLPRDGDRFRTDFGGAPMNEGVWLLIASQDPSGLSDLTIGLR